MSRHEQPIAPVSTGSAQAPSPPTLAQWAASIIYAVRDQPLAPRLAIAVAFVVVALLIRLTVFPDLANRPTYVPFHAAVILSAVLTGPIGCALATALSLAFAHALFVPLHDASDIPIILTFMSTAAILTLTIELLVSAHNRIASTERTLTRDANLRRFIEQAPVSIAMFDRDMRYVAVSRQWLERYHIDDPGIIGRLHYDHFPDFPAELKAFHARALAGEHLRSEDVTEIPVADGPPIWDRWEILPWRVEDGTIGGITIFTKDVTAERALRENKDSLKRAQAVARVASWRMNFAANELIGTQQTFSLLGHPPEAVLDYDRLLAIVHPEDRDEVNATRRTALKGASYDIEYRVVINGARGWMRERSEPEFGPTGAVVGAFGVIQDITDRKTIELDLRTSEERLRLALEAAGMAVWDWDMRTGQDVWNAQSYRMIGYEPGEIAPGFETWQRHIHPDDRDRVTAQYKRSLEQGTDVVNENRIIDRFGNVKWVSVRGRTVCDPSGRPKRSFGVITDITERKQAEERDRLLTAEVNHRAKNLLAVVQAVAIQTARHCKPDQFVETFDDRLKSLAASHDLLVSTKWQGVEIGTLMRSQLSHFADLIDQRIFLSGPKAEVMPDAAQAIGLAIHELVTNAAKYGALSSPNGKIDVTWSIEKPPGREPDFLIRWQETGGPPVTEPAIRGFGHSILVDMVEYSTSATVDLSFPPAGLVWTLLAPAHVVLRPGGA